MTITPGIKNEKQLIVTEELTAAHIGSGLARVFATPMMISLMESTCSEGMTPYLEEGQSTVGTHIDVAHSAATPVGMKVRCESELVEIDRRRLVFEVRVYDEVELIGNGRHERFIIDSAKFQAKVDGKSSVIK
ncbi:MAG: thioesterase family protein [Bacteroidales bacterium]|nr:thioesterase family protein [Bacteroidales bacterium]